MNESKSIAISNFEGQINQTIPTSPKSAPKLHLQFRDPILCKKFPNSEENPSSERHALTIIEKDRYNSENNLMRNFFYSPIAKKFIHKLKQAIIYKRISSLTDQVRQTINDVSDVNEPKIDIPEWIHGHFLTGLTKTVFKLWNRLDGLPVLEPYENAKFLWDLLNFIILNFLIFWIPFEMSFGLYLPNVINIIFLLVFSIDIFLRMNTAYFFNGFVIKKRSMILPRYLKNFFFWDIITIIGFGIDHPISGEDKSYSSTVYFILKMIFLLRFRNLTTIYSNFIERLNSKFNVKDSVLDLINLMYVSILILHIFACGWYFIADMYSWDNSYTTWLTKLDLSMASFEMKYIYSLYWSSVTIMTVGYGDITPQNPTEVCFNIFAIFLGCGVVAYIISAINNIIIDINKENQIFKENIYIMNKYMSRKQISSNLQMKVRQHLRFIWQEELTQNSELEDSIMGKLSRSLKEELFLEANGSVLNKHSMFFANFSENMLRTLMYQMKEIRFNPEDMIFKENVMDDCEIYFVVKGKVQVSIDSIQKDERSSRLNLATLTKGEVFGELAFFTGQARSASAQSKEFSTMIYIRREEFLNILAKFPEDYEKYCLMRDQMILDKNFNSINMSCYSCKQFDHLIMNCPLLHYGPSEFHIKRLQYDPGRPKRRKFRRRKGKSLNSLLNNAKLVAKAKDFHNSPIKLKKFQGKLEIIESEEEDEEENLQKDSEPNEELNKIPQILIKENNSKTNNNNLKIDTNNNKNTHEGSTRKSIVQSPINLENNTNVIEFFENSNRNYLMSQSHVIIEGAYKNSFVVDEFTRQEFDKIGRFKSFYPDFNLKNILKKLEILKKLIKETKKNNPLKKYFLEKKLKTLKAVAIIPILETRKSTLDVSNLKKKKMSSIFTENQLSPTFFGRKRVLNFYDLVVEVLANDELRKKLAIIKMENLKKKNRRTRTRLFR